MHDMNNAGPVMQVLAFSERKRCLKSVGLQWLGDIGRSLASGTLKLSHTTALAQRRRINHVKSGTAIASKSVVGFAGTARIEDGDGRRRAEPCRHSERTAMPAAAPTSGIIR